METKRMRYEAPSAEVLELRVEQSILIASDPLNNPDSGYDPLFDMGIL